MVANSTGIMREGPSTCSLPPFTGVVVTAARAAVAAPFLVRVFLILLKTLLIITVLAAFLLLFHRLLLFSLQLVKFTKIICHTLIHLLQNNQKWRAYRSSFCFCLVESPLRKLFLSSSSSDSTRFVARTGKCVCAASALAFIANPSSRMAVTRLMASLTSASSVLLMA